MKTKLIYSIFILFEVFYCAATASESERELKFKPGIKIGFIKTSSIQEASGIVASRKNKSILWVHNDSGNSARVYAINYTGKLLGTFTIKDARCRDWEDIAIGPGPDKNSDYLYIGDIGDNEGKQSKITVYRIPEPNVNSNTSDKKIKIGPPDVIELTYPDSPKDSETLLVDPLNGDIYIITKRNVFSRVYHAPYPQSTDKPTKMAHAGILPWGLATGGDVSPDGKQVIIRGPTSASIWKRPDNEPLWRVFPGEYLTIELIPEPQGEAICFDSNGLGFFTLSEKPNQPLYYYPASDSPEEPN
ncbi:MAG: hypothetical protein JXA96_09810 [Sedimentisphaerales bacterium]|nr:hypothetical protein [Sedimentisphaerales bacterium]